MSAMQAMMTKVLGDMLQNLPPDIKEKIETVGQFTAMLDGRLRRIENDQQRIMMHLGINDANPNKHERLLTDERHDQRGNGAATPIGD